MVYNNNESQSKRLSTPSFKSPEEDENKEDNNLELKKLNELLLKKITEYETILKINQNNDKIEEDKIDINKLIIENNNIINDNSEIKYFQDKYIHYFKLAQEYKKKCEFYELSNENIKNDLLKSKSEIKELTTKLKDNNIIFDNNNNNNNNNNYITSLSSIKLNNQYSPNEYIILCDKVYHKLKWFLMKRKFIENKEDEKETYDNLIWVPIIDVVDLNNFNKYINEEEQNNNNDIINFVKKLEEKENIISILTYKLEKLEKDFDFNYTYNSFEQRPKSQISKLNSHIIKNSINEESNDNEYVISFKKDSLKNPKNLKLNEPNIPINKFNSILEKLNQTEENFSKLQKENMELKKYQKLYLQQNNNNPINMISKESNQSNEVNLNNNNKNIYTKACEEGDYYKNKYDELEMKLKIMKEACKNILIRLTIPKKDKEEIKQILKLFEFSDEETLIIIGDKRK